MHTGPIPAIVTAEITMDLIIGHDQGVPVPADFSYSAHEPYSVTVRFHTPDEVVQWTFARDLLRSGTETATGDGDITCWPAALDGRRIVCIALRSPNGNALLEAPADEISSFVNRTFESVPAGAEAQHLDIDGLIQELLDASD